MLSRTELADDVLAGSVIDRLAARLVREGLRLGRVWPRDVDHLLLEARAGEELVAGQWFASAERAAAVARRTPGATRVDTVVVQRRGADRRLTGLAGCLAEPGARIVAHRAERRAVVRQETGAGDRAGGAGVRGYVKVVRPDRTADTARLARIAAALLVPTPAVLTVDPARGTVVTAPLPGTPLHELLSGPAGPDACREAGRVLARVHRTPPPPGLTEHGNDEEREVLRRWVGLARAYGLPPAFPDLDEGRKPGPGTADRALLHRDVHDKQFVVGSDGEVGLLDFDLMAVGDPMLDLGNLLAHLDLRERQGRVADARPLRDAVLEGYRPTAAQAARLPDHERRTWLRLSAVYAFRVAGIVS